MRLRTPEFVGLSILYWLVALALSGLAMFAPCGLAPGAWCDDPGPGWFGTALAYLGPSDVLLIAGAAYLAAVLLILGPRKSH